MLTILLTGAAIAAAYLAYRHFTKSVTNAVEDDELSLFKFSESRVPSDDATIIFTPDTDIGSFEFTLEPTPNIVEWRDLHNTKKATPRKAVKKTAPKKGGAK